MIAGLVVFGMTVLLVIGAKETAKFNAVVTSRESVGGRRRHRRRFYGDSSLELDAVRAERHAWNHIWRLGRRVRLCRVRHRGDVRGRGGRSERDLPFGILGSLGICATLYCIMCVVITGMIPYADIDVHAPFAIAFSHYGMKWIASTVSIGAAAITTSLLLSMMGQRRIFMVMARDGLLPDWFSKVSEKYGTPANASVFSGVVTGVLAVLLDIDILAQLVSIGTLSIFAASIWDSSSVDARLSARPCPSARRRTVVPPRSWSPASRSGSIIAPERVCLGLAESPSPRRRLDGEFPHPTDGPRAEDVSHPVRSVPSSVRRLAHVRPHRRSRRLGVDSIRRLHRRVPEPTSGSPSAAPTPSSPRAASIRAVRTRRVAPRPTTTTASSRSNSPLFPPPSPTPRRDRAPNPLKSNPPTPAVSSRPPPSPPLPTPRARDSICKCFVSLTRVVLVRTRSPRARRAPRFGFAGRLATFSGSFSGDDRSRYPRLDRTRACRARSRARGCTREDHFGAIRSRADEGETDGRRRRRRSAPS